MSESYARPIMDFLRAVGADHVRYEHAGTKHPRIRYVWKGEERSKVLPCTPGDTYRGPKRAICDLRHQLGLVRTVARVGERREREHKTRAARPVECPALTALPDWHAQLEALR